MNEMKTLAAKLCRIYGEVSALEKEGNNSFAKYKYFTEGQMLQYLRPLLTKEGVFIFHSVESIQHKEVSRGDKNKVELHSVVKTLHTFVCSETGELFTVGSVGEGIDSGDKATYKAITGATKYFYMKSFGITDSQDPEADEKVDSIRPVTPTLFKKDVVPNKESDLSKTDIIPNKQDNFYRQALLKAIKAEGIPEDFVIQGCLKTNWIDRGIFKIESFPEGKAQALLENLPKLKETWLKSQENK